MYSGCLMARLVVKAHQLVSAECQRCIGPPIIVAEFDLVHFRGKNLDHRPDLSSQESFFGKVFEEGNHR